MTTPGTALLACLLAGWPGAEKCHQDLVAKGPAAIAEVKPGLMAALKADPGREVREFNNAAALLSSAKRVRRAHPDTAKLKRATSAAQELARLGDWKPLLALGTITAVEGLAELDSPPAPVLTALARWARGDDDRLRYAAANALKKYGPKAAPVVPEMIAALDLGKHARASAMDVLEAVGPGAKAAVPRLGVLLKDKDWASGAYSTLKAIGTPEAEKLLDENPPWVPVSN